jgi:hypothetical protein
MKNVFIVAILGLFLGLGLPPGSTSLMPQNSCYPDGWVYDEDNATWSIEFSGVVNASFIETYGILEKSSVGVIFSHEYSFSNDSRGYIETSYNHGDTWNVMKTFHGNISELRDVFVTLTTNSLWVRFTVESKGGNGYWRVWDIDLIGDTRGGPPVSRIIYTGIIPDFWFHVPVRIEIIASDELSGIREIHYLLFGKENIVYQERAKIEISKNGIHQLIWWAVDKLGNEEIPQISPYFKIDTGEPPEVKIIEPTPGIYMFNNRICPAEKVILFGGFTIEAYANDLTSGVYDVAFYLDRDWIGSTKSSYKCYCGYTHAGEGTLKAVACDFAGNRAETTLDIVYYNFF